MMCLEFITRTEKSNKSLLDLITGKIFWLLKKTVFGKNTDYKSVTITIQLLQISFATVKLINPKSGKHRYNTQTTNY